MDLWTNPGPFPCETWQVLVQHKIAFCVTHDSWQRNEIKIHGVFPLHRTFTSIRFRVSRSLSFAALSPLPSSFPRLHSTRLDSTRSRSFRKTQPPRKTILSHNLNVHGCFYPRPFTAIFLIFVAGNLNPATFFFCVFWKRRAFVFERKIFL